MERYLSAADQHLYNKAIVRGDGKEVAIWRKIAKCNQILKTYKLNASQKSSMHKTLAELRFELANKGMVTAADAALPLLARDGQNIVKGILGLFFPDKVLKHENTITQVKVYENIRRQSDLVVEEQTSLIDKINAEVETARNNTRITAIRSAFLQKVTAELTLESITPEQCYMLIKLIDPNANTEIDLSERKMVEEQLEKMKQETRALRSKADVSEATAKKTIDEINQLRNKP